MSNVSQQIKRTTAIRSALAAIGVAVLVVAIGLVALGGGTNPRFGPIESSQGCPQYRAPITGEHLASQGFENPEFPEAFLRAATGQSLYCGWHNHDFTSLEVHVSAAGEERELWAVIAIGKLDSQARAESTNIPHINAGLGSLPDPKPLLVEYQLGEHSLLAVNPRSKLAALVDAGGAKATLEILRWEEKN